MNDRDRKRLRRGESVRDFASNMTLVFTEGSKGAEVVGSIAQLVERLNALSASSATNTRTLRAVADAKKDARKELREALRAISRTAHAIGLDDPDLRDKFRLPVGTLSDQSLLSTARSFATEAAPVSERFVAYGMGADFADALGQKIAAFEGQASAHHASRSARASDNASVAATLDELDRQIERLDAVMRNAFASDPSTLAAWEVARHLERAPKKRKGGGGNGGTPTPAPRN
jgi:hypothetical protein